MAHMWAQWLATPCRLGGPRCSARGQNQKWPTCGDSGYLTPAVLGVPNALHGHKIRNGPHVGIVATYPLPSGVPNAKSEMGNMWTQWLTNPYRVGGPQCSSRGQNQKWPTCGHSGYLTPAVSGVAKAKHEQNQKWPTCGDSGYLPLAVSGVPNALHGDKIRNGPHVGTMATYPLPPWGSPMLGTGTKSEMAHMWG